MEEGQIRPRDVRGHAGLVRRSRHRFCAPSKKSDVNQRGCGHQLTATDPDTDSYSRQGLQRTERPWSDVGRGATPPQFGATAASPGQPAAVVGGWSRAGSETRHGELQRARLVPAATTAAAAAVCSATAVWNQWPDPHAGVGGDNGACHAKRAVSSGCE